MNDTSSVELKDTDITSEPVVANESQGDLLSANGQNAQNHGNEQDHSQNYQKNFNLHK